MPCMRERINRFPLFAFHRHVKNTHFDLFSMEDLQQGFIDLKIERMASNPIFGQTRKFIVIKYKKQQQAQFGKNDLVKHCPSGN